MIEAFIGILNLFWTTITAFFSAHWIFALIIIIAIASIIIKLLGGRK